jgi:NADH-quinone oxidoreductase subunit L
MAIPLILLAVGSVFAGYVGVPHALGGSNWIETYLEPSFEAHGAGVAGSAGAALATPGGLPVLASIQEPALQEPGVEPGEAEAHGSPVSESTELLLMAVSIGAAAAGFGIAFYFWFVNRAAADAVARNFSGLHRLLLGKYYVDEIYDGAIVQPLKSLSTVALWRGVDAGLIDGKVNGVGAVVRGSSAGLRRLQTGSVRVYAASLFAGVVLILGYYLWN